MKQTIILCSPLASPQSIMSLATVLELARVAVADPSRWWYLREVMDDNAMRNKLRSALSVSDFARLEGIARSKQSLRKVVEGPSSAAAPSSGLRLSTSVLGDTARRRPTSAPLRRTPATKETSAKGAQCRSVQCDLCAPANAPPVVTNRTHAARHGTHVPAGGAETGGFRCME